MGRSPVSTRSEQTDMSAVLEIVPEVVPMLESFLTDAWRQGAAEIAFGLRTVIRPWRLYAGTATNGVRRRTVSAAPSRARTASSLE